MVLSLHKSMSKLSIVQATRELRRARQIPQQMSININDCKLDSVEHAKLLGITRNQDMTWEHHLWGARTHHDEKLPGLLCQLSRALGMIGKLSNIMQPKQLRSLAMGLQQSRLLFGLLMVGGLWLPEKYLDRHWNHQSTTKQEMDLLQQSQNRMMNILSGERDPMTLTTKLLEATNMLSVSQLTFAATATNLVNEIGNDGLSLGGVNNLGVELQSVKAGLGVFDRGKA